MLNCSIQGHFWEDTRVLWAGLNDSGGGLGVGWCLPRHRGTSGGGGGLRGVLEEIWLQNPQCPPSFYKQRLITKIGWRKGKKLNTYTFMHRETHPDTPHTTHTSVSLAYLVHKKKIFTRIVMWPLKKEKKNFGGRHLVKASKTLGRQKKCQSLTGLSEPGCPWDLLFICPALTFP